MVKLGNKQELMMIRGKSFKNYFLQWFLSKKWPIISAKI